MFVRYSTRCRYKSVISFLFNNEIKEKLSTACRSSIRRYLLKCGYRNVLPRSTHMLTSEHKQRHIQWAQEHQNNDR
ncbi:hypothetical protein I4U23_016608 [Adineta vaga]|nr:hypothetical protein I4U23_016608 [Adineta vaga]